MQTSGMAPQFSDGVRKQVTGKTVNAPKKTGNLPLTPKAAGPKNTHRVGGFAKHQRSK